MKLKKDGLITRFYKWSFSYGDDQLTQNFCGYFWSVVFAFIFLPFTAWSAAVGLTWPEFRKSDPPFGVRIVMGGVCYVICAALVMLGIKLYLAPVDTLIGIGVAVSIAASVSLLMYVFVIRDKTSQIGKALDEARDLIVEKVESVKEGYCPKIDWK